MHGLRAGAVMYPARLGGRNAKRLTVRSVTPADLSQTMGNTTQQMTAQPQDPNEVVDILVELDDEPAAAVLAAQSLTPGTAAAEKAAEGRTAQLFPSFVPLDGRGAAGNSRSADRAELPLRCFCLAAEAAGRSMRAVLWAGAARRLHGLWPLHRRLPDRGSRAGARRACGPALCGGILHRVQSLCTALPAGRAGTRAALCRAARVPAGPLT